MLIVGLILYNIEIFYFKIKYFITFITFFVLCASISNLSSGRTYFLYNDLREKRVVKSVKTCSGFDEIGIFIYIFLLKPEGKRKIGFVSSFLINKACSRMERHGRSKKTFILSGFSVVV